MKYYIIPVTSFNQNCSVIWCEKSREAILVDPGGEQEKLFNVINKLKVKIKKIILTHGHLDHVGAAYDLKRYYNASIYGPNQHDQFLLDNLDLQFKMFNINNVYKNAVIIPDFWLEDRDYIKVGYETFSVLHCPGHSPGHVVLWNKARKFIVMGDVLFKQGIGRSDLPGGNYDNLIKSIKTKLLPLGDEVTFLPGHGPISTIGYERVHNRFIFSCVS